jgi:hypothetical protein
MKILAGLCLIATLVHVPARAADVEVCFDYGCSRKAAVRVGPEALEIAREAVAAAPDAATERHRVAAAVASLYAIAAQQSPIWRDLPRNPIDERHLEGAMDCIDHSTNTDTFLHLLDSVGALRFHRPGGRALRFAFLVFGEHWTATLVEKEGGASYAIDTWFGTPGETPAVVGLERWRAGFDPDHERAASR